MLRAISCVLYSVSCLLYLLMPEIPKGLISKSRRRTLAAMFLALALIAAARASVWAQGVSASARVRTIAPLHSTDTLINAPVRRATDKLFGLNRFEIDPLIAGRGGASPTARLTVGRQINKNLSITYSTNLTSDQNQVLALEYRVSNRLSFVAQYEQGSVNGFSSRNDNFSFEIRFRKRF